MTPEQTQLALMVGIGLLVLALLIWLFLRANRKATVIRDEGADKDVLDEGAAPAARNQALIDAPQAAVPSPLEEPAAPEVAPEPIPVPAPAPAPTPAPAATSAPATEADDLRQIKGLGPKLVTILAEQGITRFDQIAAWTDADVERIDATLGRFAGRITRDQWVEQAKLLISGDVSAFDEKFGRNG